MIKFSQSILPLIETSYESLTSTERIVEDFFVEDKHQDEDYSIEHLGEVLHVSPATFTRFAKKLGYSGYREFLYDYRTGLPKKQDDPGSQNIEKVLSDYNAILNKSYNLANSDQLFRIANAIRQAERVIIYGVGSSALAAEEMTSRLLRLGIVSATVSDADAMRVHQVVIDEACCVLGFSISGQKKVVLNSLRQAAQQGAYTILVTANFDVSLKDQFDEIVRVATVKNLNSGNRISPQLPIIIMCDIIYDYLIEIDRENIQRTFERTMDVFEEGEIL